MLRTYVFECQEIWCTNEPGGVSFPARWNEVHFEYTVFGQLTTTDLAEAERQASAPGQIQLSVATPIRDSAILNVNLPKESRVDLSIWNVAGRRVADILNATVAPGPHVVRWSGQSSSGQPVASGLYFARLVAGDITITRKVVVLR